MNAVEFINILSDLDPQYLLVPEEVDLTGIEIVEIQRHGDDFVFPDGVYYNREAEQFEDLVSISEEEETEDYFILLEEQERKYKLECEENGIPYHPF